VLGRFIRWFISITTLGFGWLGYFAGAGLVGLFAPNLLAITVGGFLASFFIAGTNYIIQGRLIGNLRREFETSKQENTNL